MEMKVHCAHDKLVSIDKLKPHPKNANEHPEDQVERLAEILAYQGWRSPIKVSKRSGFITAGHGRILAARFMGWTQAPVNYQDYESEDQEIADVHADNAIAAWAQLDFAKINDQLKDFDPQFNVDLLGIRNFEIEPLDKLNLDGDSLKLSDRFVAPPFSVLDAKQGYWKVRKDHWMSLGIKSEIGREEDRTLKGTPSSPEMIPDYYKKIKAGQSREQIIRDHAESGSTVSTGTSVFDPVLCEVAYTWFSPKDAVIVDPFAGGSVRGVVAARLGRQYIGMELRQQQVDANREQWSEISAKIPDANAPAWTCGDSRELDKRLPDVAADMIFSCPPYADLEVYSDDPRDLSNMTYDDFLDAYREIIQKAVGRLKDNRFIVWVVGEVRNRTTGGYYKNFVADTIQAFLDAGAGYYNELIYLTPLGTVQVRCGRVFEVSRKVGKTHQNVLVFCKGDPIAAAKYCGDISVGDLTQFVEADL